MQWRKSCFLMKRPMRQSLMNWKNQKNQKSWTWNWKQSWPHLMMNCLLRWQWLSQILRWRHLWSYLQSCYWMMLLMRSQMSWKRRSCLRMMWLMRNQQMKHQQHLQRLYLRCWLCLRHWSNLRKQQNQSCFLCLSHYWLMKRRTNYLQLLIVRNLMHSGCYYYQVSPSSKKYHCQSNLIQLMPSWKNFHLMQSLSFKNLRKMKTLNCLKNWQQMKQKMMRKTMRMRRIYLMRMIRNLMMKTRKTRKTMKMMKTRRMRMKNQLLMRLRKMMRNYSKMKLMNWMNFQLYSKNWNWPNQMRTNFQSLKRKNQHSKQSLLHLTNQLRQMKHRSMSLPYQMSFVYNYQLLIHCSGSQWQFGSAHLLWRPQRYW